MPKSPLRQQYDEAVAKYEAMVTKPPQDFAMSGEFTKAWLENCDTQARYVRHLKAALKLKEPRRAVAAHRRK